MQISNNDNLSILWWVCWLIIFNIFYFVSIVEIFLKSGGVYKVLPSNTNFQLIKISWNLRFHFSISMSLYLPRSPIEHSVFIMYFIGLYKKREKKVEKEFDFFLDLMGFVPTILRDRLLRPNHHQISSQSSKTLMFEILEAISRLVQPSTL